MRFCQSIIDRCANFLSDESPTITRKHESPRTLPAARRRARVPPRTRMVVLVVYKTSTMAGEAAGRLVFLVGRVLSVLLAGELCHIIALL